MRVHEPLVNAETLTIEVMNVNGTACPGNSFQEAVSKFDEYVLGDVRIVNSDPVQLDLGDDGALSKTQFDELLSKSQYAGQSVINFVVAPDYEYMDNRGTSAWLKNNEGIRNVISINAKKCNKDYPFISQEDFWRVVILHELCHSLNVPARKSHVQGGRHCTDPGCVLYPKIDIFSAMAGIVNLGSPEGLCKQCKEEVQQSHKLANGTFYDDSKIFNRFGGLIELNPGNLDAIATSAFYDLVYDDKEKAIEKFDILLAKKPKYIYPKVNNGISAFALRAGCHYNLKRYDKALSDYQRATEVMPEDPHALRECARIMCTSQEDKLRNGDLAISLAEKACKLEDWRNPVSLDVLACAYAEVGDFNSAIKYEQQAISLQEMPKESCYSKHLELFEKGISYKR